MKKWYRINIDWKDGFSSSSPAGDELDKAIYLFKCKSIENKEDLSSGLIYKMNLTEHKITNGGTFADVTRVVKWKKTRQRSVIK